MVTALWSDQSGFVISIELVLISTLLVIGLITGMTALRDAVVSELSDIGGAIQDLNQSYTFNGISHRSGNTRGSSWTDARDWCDTQEDQFNAAENCITFNVRPTNEI